MAQQDEPDDYVIATIETQSVKEFVKLDFSYVDLYWKKHVVIDEIFYRPSEAHMLIGDYSTGKRKLGWEQKVKFEELVKIMVEANLRNCETIRSL